MATNGTSQYNADSITVLEGLEAVRRRPGMYVGGTDIKALHHLVYEVVDNSIDEALGGYCHHIYITLHPDEVVSVEDDGRGIPVGEHPEKKISSLQLVMTTLHAGGKFDRSSYKVSGGLHGVGVSAVNALCEWLEAEITREGGVWRQRYERGIPVTPVEQIATLPAGQADKTGTKMTFRFDREIFKEVEGSYMWDTLLVRFREMAFVTKGIRITFVDARGDVPNEHNFYFEGGVTSFVRYLNRNREALHLPVHVEKTIEDIGVEVAIQYTDAYTESIYAFANTIHTPDGGTHMTGLRGALTRTINDYARKNNILKENDNNFSGDDTREGLTAIVSIKHPDPQFESQTKVKLMNAEVRNIVETVVADQFAAFLEENPRYAKAIIDKCLTSSRARDAAKKARDLVLRKSALESTTLPGKLADCSNRDSENSELFLVEGDSAGGCFSGDTKIALADGRALTFKEIIAEQADGKEHFCYTIRHDGKIGLERIINPRCTKTNAEVVKLTLDNGETIICTPDHLFMLRDGSYQAAVQLTPHDSLMPLYRKLSDKAEAGITIDGYEMVLDPRSDSWLFTHVLADWYNRWQGVYDLTTGDHCHHLDFNKLNNNPTNIQRLPIEEHLALHNRHLEYTLHRPETIDKARKAHQTESYRQMMSKRMQQPETRQILSEQAKVQWEDETYKAYMVQKWREFYNSNEEYKQRNNEQLLQIQREYWSQEAHRQAQAERTRNYYIDHPEARETLSQIASDQWQDETLLAWRREKTKEQWTPEFRTRRKAALNQTYYRKTMTVLKRFETNAGQLDLESYHAYRLQTSDKSLLRFDKFCERYFEGDKSRVYQALANYNHRIVSVERLPETIDVYDLEVAHTHNFALASGVFVHNSAKQGRDRRFQAILPLRGKILNTERARLDKTLGSNEVKAMITALGTGIGDDFDVAKLRYGRIIIATDADVDGAHIRTLLLTFFFRYMPTLIESGHLYIAQPPLYRIKYKKDVTYAYTDHEKDAYLQKLDKNEGQVLLQRYKGLGEMNPEQLWETTMNPEHRILLQVTVEDATAADKTFDMLMGAAVPPRRKFIQTHAKQVQNLDI